MNNKSTNESGKKNLTVANNNGINYLAPSIRLAPPRLQNAYFKQL